LVDEGSETLFGHDFSGSLLQTGRGEGFDVAHNVGEVAQLAGVPREVIRKAKTALAHIESENASPKRRVQNENDNVTFEDLAKDDVVDRIKKLDIDMLTPLEALNVLCELRKML